MDRAPWDEGIEPGDGKPRVGSALGCLLCAGVFVTGLVLFVFDLMEITRTGRLPDQGEIVECLGVLGVILLMGGFGGRFAARWALARGDWPGRLIPALKRVSWTVGLGGLGLMLAAFIWNLVLVLFFGD